jgi:hypothetical protein
MTQSEPNLRLPMIIWVQFVFSFLIFAVVLFVGTQGQTPKPDTLTTLGPAMGFMALFALASIPLLRTRVQGAQTLFGLMPPLPSGQWNEGLDPGATRRLLQAAAKKYQTGMIIGMAMCEAAVLFGFALGYVSAIPLVIAPFIVGAFLGVVLQFPTRDGVIAVARALRAAESPQ